MVSPGRPSPVYRDLDSGTPVHKVNAGSVLACHNPSGTAAVPAEIATPGSEPGSPRVLGWSKAPYSRAGLAS